MITEGSDQEAAPIADQTTLPPIVVGIGASAGGLDACRVLFEGMQLQTGLAFVLIMHLHPERASHVAMLLANWTAMTVTQVDHPCWIEPDHVYVISPDSSLRIQDGVLFPEKPTEPHGQRRPVDDFLSSLAEAQGARAVAIILSGTGHDGSSGIRAIAAHRGLCLVQDPETAQYDGMPKSAIDTGAPVQVLPIEEIPAALLQRAAQPIDYQAGEEEEVRPEPLPEPFEEILGLLGRQYGIDFGAYKKATLLRRTGRRMGLKQLADWSAYLEYLRRDPDELAALYSDLLIGVTTFFRDPETWAYAKEELLPQLIDQCLRDGRPSLRIWVPGCATGEEAYSWAILVLELLQESKRKLKLQIYATDINTAALRVARRGAYPAGAVAADLSPERIKRFLHQEGEGVRINQEVREAVTFAVHNVLTDPPFSRLDLVSCRNLLIYLQPRAQDEVLRLIHFALLPGGVLILGGSETLGRQLGLFAALSKKHRVYRASRGTSGAHPVMPAWREQPAPIRGFPLPPPELPKGPRIDRLVERRVLSRHSAACVAINRSFQILYLFGPTEDYLTQPTGEARMGLLGWARPGLYASLRSLLTRAMESGAPTHRSDLQVERDGTTHRVECTVEPIPGSAGLYLVVFREAPPPHAEAILTDAERERVAVEKPVIHQLEEELKGARQELAAVLDQLHSLNGEYRASHEELLSLNQELQSSNEELETSKEELQSLNEELITINKQIEVRNGELRVANADLRNFLDSTSIPTLFLDRRLRLRQFTPASTRVMRLVSSDLGRSIEHIKYLVEDDRLVRDSREVLERLAPIEAEVEDEEGRFYLRKITPYRTEDDRIDGVCITFTDITAQRQLSEARELQRQDAAAIIDTMRSAVLVLDEELRVTSVNPMFCEMFQVTKEDTEGRLFFELGERQWDIPRLKALLEEVLPERKSIVGYEVTHDFPGVGRREMTLNARRMERKDRPDSILIAIEDVTGRRRAEREALRREEELRLEHERKDEFLAMLGHELRNPLGALIHGLELLRRVEGDPRRSEEIRNMMARQSGSMRELLEQILDVSRLISGKTQIAKEPVDLVEVANASLETVAPLIEAKHHQLELVLPPPERLFVLGEALRLRQILENLLTNAAKYTPDGGRIWLTVATGVGQAQLKVRDNGIGMEADLLPHVFELFTQGHRSLDRTQGGLGLGLPLVRRLVEMHGGRVEASSAGPGQGSEFVVSLPLYDRKTVERGTRAPEAVPELQRQRRILVVEDEEDGREALATILELDGHQVEAVADGPAALAAMTRFDPDVVLLDLGLPDMDGYEVARRLRAQHRDKHFLLIALTGYQENLVRLREAGIDKHLMKPADMSKLASWLATD